ncbi:MAG: trypsin-like peptidase domain-containing protein [Pseudonocardiales bacterium]|nr:trypsin-like peptidase domain-containing protein [Pseudonocardiales bacterium]
MRDSEWHDGPNAGPPRAVYTGVFLLVALVLVLGGGVAWYRADQLATEFAEQRAIATAAKSGRPPFTPTEVEMLANKVTPVLVDVETEIRNLGIGGAGTGIVLSQTGEVLTNNHVINGATTLEVVTKSNQKRYSARVVGYDRNHDVALLQITDPKTLATAVICDSSSVQSGQPILGIGNAGGAGGKPIRAPGKVTGVGRSINTSDELTESTERLQGLIEIAADIRPGDSGGPLVNEAGQVIGVNTAASINYKTNIPNGVGYAIPINDAMGIVQTIRAGHSTGEVHVGPTGIIGIAVSGPAMLPGGYLPRSAKPGATVTQIASGSPAEATGLQRGDTIVELDGAVVDSPTQLTAIVGRHRPGDRLTVAWVDRAGQRRSGAVTLDEGPPA